MKDETIIRLAGGWKGSEIVGRTLLEECVLCFLEDLSKEIRSNPMTRNREDCAAFAFWCRRKHLESSKEALNDRESRLGWGMIFHIAPSNIPTLFAYSMVFGMLAGNGNVIRISSRVMEESLPLCQMIEQVMQQKKYQDIYENTLLFTCERGDGWIETYTNLCDGRVIWGGDKAIEELRKIPVRPGVTELEFADRYSIAVIDTEWMKQRSEEELQQLSYQFYNDTFAMDQNACSSPKLIVWKGEDRKCFETWWEQCMETAKRYELSPWKVSRKYEEVCLNIMETDQIEKVRFYDNRIYVADLQECPRNPEQYDGRFGCFYQCIIQNLEELMPSLNRKIQTIEYAGVSPKELQDRIVEFGAKGGDRIVPLGQALSLDYMWDGINVIEHLSRVICTVERRGN